MKRYLLPGVWLTGHPTHEKYLRLALYLTFIAYALHQFLGSPGDDLSSSYIACRLIASDQLTHLYDYHPEFFHLVQTPAWIQAAREAQFLGFLHPYVQIPLWAWSLQPLCINLDFDTVNAWFLLLSLVSIAVMVEFVARHWASRFQHPLWLALLLTAITWTTPFQYAMWLGQTHAIFLALTIIALIAAEQGRIRLAGAFLAIAVAVKITPILFFLYWLLKKQWRPAIWFLVWCACIALASIAATGIHTLLDYLHSMHRVSNTLLLSYNNQSLAAWLGYAEPLASELKNWRSFPLSLPIKILSVGASLACLALAAWIQTRCKSLPTSIAIILTGMTVFSPLAWTHYYLVLIPVSMILLQQQGLAPALIVLTVFLLNVMPFAVDPIQPSFEGLAIVRSHFVAALILIATLSLLNCRKYQKEEISTNSLC